MPALIYPPYFTEKARSKLPSHLFMKEDGGLGGLPNNFAKVTTILDNLYWKPCLLIKNVNEIHEIEVFFRSNLNFTTRVFTWDLANDNNIYKKLFCPILSIIL